VQFCLHIHHEAGLGQLLLQPLLLRLELGDLLGLRVAPLPAARSPPPGQRAGITSLAPLDDV
jgi:hypothetical protein